MAAGGALAAQGESALKEAKAEMGKWSPFGFGSSDKHERAAELYERAGNAFKGAKKYERAAECYSEAGNLQRKLGREHESVTFFTSQAECLRMVDPMRGVEVLRDTVLQALLASGRFSQAARVCEKTGEALEKAGNLREAMEMYEEASAHHMGESASAAGNRCKANAAMLRAKLALDTEDEGEKADMLNQAIDDLEAVGTGALDSAMTKFSAKKHFLHAGLLALASGDAVRAERAIESYCDLDYTFATSGEGKFLTSLAEASAGSDAQAFTNHVFQYDQIKKLDPWQTSVLLSIKRGLAPPGAGTPAAAASATAPAGDSVAVREAAPITPKDDDEFAKAAGDSDADSEGGLL